MNIQEINIEADFHTDTELKVEKFDELLSVNSAQSITKKETEDDYFDESKSIIHEEIQIKDEMEEDGQPNGKYENSTAKRKKHKYLVKNSSFGLACILCQKYFNSRQNLDGHYVSRHPNESDIWRKIIKYKINECTRCSYKSVRSGNIKKHMETHMLADRKEAKSTEKVKCKICGRKYPKDYLSQHLLIHSGQLPHICTECDKGFLREHHLNAHILSQHSNSKRLISSITCKVYHCDHCGYKTARRTHFKYHLKSCKFGVTPTDEFKFKCNVCEVRCTRKGSLERHMRLHSGQLPFKCIDCDKSFNQKTCLDYHIISLHSDNQQLMNIITNEIYRCENCDFITITSWKFTRHARSCIFNRTPNHEFKFKCNVCEYRCPSQGYLTKHLRLHDVKLRFPCTECDKSFNDKFRLDGHIISQHPNHQELLNQVTSGFHCCDKCAFKTVYTTTLKRHQKSCKNN